MIVLLSTFLGPLNKICKWHESRYSKPQNPIESHSTGKQKILTIPGSNQVIFSIISIFYMRKDEFCLQWEMWGHISLIVDMNQQWWIRLVEVLKDYNWGYVFFYIPAQMEIDENVSFRVGTRSFVSVAVWRFAKVTLASCEVSCNKHLDLSLFQLSGEIFVNNLLLSKYSINR